MSNKSADAMMAIAMQVATCMADRGYAFIEDEKVGELAEALTAFLQSAGIVVQPSVDSEEH